MRSLTFAAAMLLLGGQAALAHAFLHSADPSVGSTVPTAPQQVEITFTEGVEPAFSTVEVQDASGKRVDKGNLHAVPGSDKSLAVNLVPLPPGTYKVTWHATSVDTHKTEGTFSFTVGR